MRILGRVTVKTTTAGAWKRLAPGIGVRSPVQVVATDCAGYDVELAVEVVAGRFMATSVLVRQREGGPPVTSEGIRSIPVARLTKLAVAAHVMQVEEKDGVTTWTPMRMTDETAKRFRGEGPTDEALGWVARLYRLALLLGDPPVTAVEHGLGLPRSTAGRWVALARQRGFLGQAEGPGKAAG